MTHQGSRNFIVSSIDASNNQIDLLVNAIGNYDGVRPLNFLTAAPPVARLEIQADGPWSFEITPAEQAPVVPVPGHVDGNGDFVGLLSGADTAHFVYSGDRNFIVHTYGNTQELVANEIGPYDGEVLIPNDTTIIEVQTTGPWSADFTS